MRLLHAAVVFTVVFFSSCFFFHFSSASVLPIRVEQIKKRNNG